MFRIKKWYINFLEGDKRNFLDYLFLVFFYFLSLIYGLIVRLKNFSYDKRILTSFSAGKKVISVGNLSWSGSGKTTLSIWLYERLAGRFKTAVLRRGYGRDENELLRERIKNVFWDVDRVSLIKGLLSQFDVFILDDGFQYRKLKRDVDIVIMGRREFGKPYRLIPAGFFREPLSSLRRAGVLLLNYTDEIKVPLKIKEDIQINHPHLKIYFSQYRFKKIIDLKGKSFDLDYFKGKEIGVFTAIGYPQGFLNKLRELNFKIADAFIFPDHYELKAQEFIQIQESLLKMNVNDLIITHKDKYHIPSIEMKINVFILEVDIDIEDGDGFMKDILTRMDNLG